MKVTSSKPTHEFISKTDPEYLDLRYFPKPDPGEHWVHARLEQVAAVEKIDRERRPVRKSRETIPYQDNRRNSGPLLANPGGFRESLPRRPYVVHGFPGVPRIRQRDYAHHYRYVQANHPSAVRWVLFDLDHADACARVASADAAPPNIIVVNPQDQERPGRAHIFYLLRTPVACHSTSNPKPLAFLAAIERGLTRRLGADPAFVKMYAKNPLHEDWQVIWQREQPYTLADLAFPLAQEDMRPARSRAETTGLGRNVDVFEALRHAAYQEVLRFKRQDRSEAEFRTHLGAVALDLNAEFAVPMSTAEVRGIAKSVAKWTWGHFSVSTFAVIQARRSARRWKDHVALDMQQPWAVEGISRATWYRRRKSQTMTS